MKKKLKASRLIAILQSKIKKFGDLDISINTQDSSSYFLYDNSSCVNKIEWHDRNNAIIYETLEIG